MTAKLDAATLRWLADELLAAERAAAGCSCRDCSATLGMWRPGLATYLQQRADRADALAQPPVGNQLPRVPAEPQLPGGATAGHVLLQAAQVLEEAASGATDGPWWHVDYVGYRPGEQSTYMGCGSVITTSEDMAGGDVAAPAGDMYSRGGYRPAGDMAYIARVNPQVGVHLGEALRRQAAFADEYPELLGHDDPLLLAAHKILEAHQGSQPQPPPREPTP